MSSFWKIFIAVIVAILVAGGSVFAIMNNQNKNNKADDQTQIDNLNKQLSDIRSQSSTNNSTSVNIFTDPQFKFSFEMPKDYIITREYGCEGECTSLLTIAKKFNNNTFDDSYIKITFNSSGDTLVGMLESYKKQYNDILEESDVTIGGASAKKLDIGGIASGFRYFAVSGKYNIDINQYPDDTENQKVIDLIISTFKFPK